MPRPALTPEQRQKIRMRIRDAASRLVKTSRLQDITVRAVAAEAGVSVGTFYTYFENLSELGQSLWMEPVEELRQEMREHAARIEDPVARIRELLENYARFAEEKNAVFRGAFLYVRPDSMQKPEKIDLDQELFFCCLRDAVLEGQQSGQIGECEPEEMAQTLWAGVHGALALPMTMDRYAFDSSQTLAARMIDSLLAMIAT